MCTANAPWGRRIEKKGIDADECRKKAEMMSSAVSYSTNGDTCIINIQDNTIDINDINDNNWILRDKKATNPVKCTYPRGTGRGFNCFGKVLRFN